MKHLVNCEVAEKLSDNCTCGEARDAIDSAIARDRLATFTRLGHLVILESPYSSANGMTIEANVAFARACIRDCLVRGESPIASHLLFTQPDILRDEIPQERERGIEAGLAWYRVAQTCVVYIDNGVTAGMALGIGRAKALGVPIEHRRLRPE